MKIGTKIRELRKRRGMTQEQLAECLNISSQAVSEWENGTSVPDMSLAPRLAAFFEMSTDELLSAKNNMAEKRVLLHALKLGYGL